MTNDIRKLSLDELEETRGGWIAGAALAVAVFKVLYDVGEDLANRHDEEDKK